MGITMMTESKGVSRELNLPYDEQLWLPEEAARYLKVSTRAVLLWARQGKMPCLRPAGVRILRFRKKDIDAWLADELPWPRAVEDIRGGRPFWTDDGLTEMEIWEKLGQLAKTVYEYVGDAPISYGKLLELFGRGIKERQFVHLLEKLERRGLLQRSADGTWRRGPRRFEREGVEL